MPTSVALGQLVDLALGSPEVGAVNFNVLHTLLHAMIQKLNIQDVRADIDEHDRELLSTHSHIGPRAYSAFSVVSADSGKGEDSFSMSEDNLSEKSSYTTPKKSPYHKLEKQVAELTRQMDELNKLPSNEVLMNKSQGKEGGDRPVSDMWQYMQLKKRVDANEEGVGKLMSLFEDLMKEMKELKDAQAGLMKKMNGIDLDTINSRLDGLDNFFKDLNDKFSAVEGLQDRLAGFASLDDLDALTSQFVTWPGLEDALKGVRLDMENLKPISEERVVIELGVQTDVVETRSRPTSARPISRASSARSTAGPSAELLDVLERLGRLAEAHEALEQRVAELERLIELKANKADLQGLGISDDLLSSLKNIQEELQALKDGQLKDEAAIRRLQEAIQKLQADIDRLKDSMEAVISENAERVKEIQDLVTYCDNLEKKKADKEYVDMEVDVKADRRQLEGKVNHSLFDSTTNELNRMIRDILDKLNGQDGDWKSALAKAMEELDGKLDRREMSSLKDWLERQLKALNSKIKAMGPGFSLDEEAAGMKKQLIQHFNCLSCDKPLDVMPNPPIASIPATYGLPKSKSPRPYTTFELDQIRQHARRIYNGLDRSGGNRLGVNPEMVDYYATIRQCGGSHTLTHPTKRITRLNNLGQLLRDDEAMVPLYKEEVDVQGADGHIYKGRVEPARIEAKLPSTLTPQPPPPVYMERQAPAPPPQPPQRLLSARVPRPSSGRPTSSQSGRSGPRFHSAAPVPSGPNESVVAPDNSQADGSRTTTPQPDVAVQMVEEENAVKEEEIAEQEVEREVQTQVEEQQQQQEEVVEAAPERPKTADAQNSTEDKD